MKSTVSHLEESSYVADFVCEIVPISVVATLCGTATWWLAKWCIATKMLAVKALLGFGGCIFGLMTIVLGLLAILAFVEFAKDALKLDR